MVVALVVENRDMELVPLSAVEASIESRRVASGQNRRHRVLSDAQTNSA